MSKAQGATVQKFELAPVPDTANQRGLHGARRDGEIGVTRFSYGTNQECTKCCPSVNCRANNVSGSGSQRESSAAER